MNPQFTYSSCEKCTYKIIEDLLHVSTTTAARMMARLKRAKGIRKYGYVSVGEFCEYYRIKSGLVNPTW